ncbi:hypothetical protein ACTI_07660 [Actinoplanes sp. OR16]|uniref:hypothetical protein n=1 Tax=Actinoplanes sp. OR16 TaxID=946334 RepID=UPI000F6B4552|nr:hypothetical protein [Actinoplanes sp. OR16]BBH64081.1 hypothetical protein ACTI_07660 [Actinoplanes sp. OR16]
MPGSALHAELNAVRTAVSHALAEVSVASEFGQFWIRSACARLAAVDAVLTEAAGVVSMPAQALVMGAVSFAAVLVSTGAARAAGLGTTGTLIAAVPALLVVAAVTPWAGRRIRMALGRRRLARLPMPQVPGPVLITVPDFLAQTRVRLVSAALRHVGSKRWTSPELAFAARVDPVTRRLAEADLLLCQSIDCLERYLHDLAKG